MAVRVYELAKKYDITSKDLIKLLNSMGVSAETHMAVLSDEAVALVDKQFKKQNSVDKPGRVEKQQEQPLKKHDTTTYSRPTAPSRGTKKPVRENPMASAKAPQPQAPAPSPLLPAPMLVGEFSEKTGKSLGDIIGTLLRQGIVIAKNQMLSEEQVSRLATFYSIPLRAKEVAQQAQQGAEKKALRSAVEAGVVRQPIVVVMGHVDHGKTTLLDTIRKARVAAREKGGITQHLGAYEVETSQGKITFLDTPGHAAFSMIRSRGAHVADIAILVIAADDGIKPQTLEALRVAQAAHIPIIVAINKIDRASLAQIEAIKGDLAQRDLVPEDWGGQTIVVPLVAKTGQGVDTLLEMISLQAQMMELNASLEGQARGCIIESTIERGLGFVATVLVRQGIFRVGDYVVSDDTEGRIVAIINAHGQRIQEALPAVPVLIAGFKTLPRAGDELYRVASLAERDAVRQKIEQRTAPVMTAGRENELRIVIKADNASSLEAVAQVLQSGLKGARPITIVHQGVGPISERDVTYVAESGALLYGLHVKWEARAQELAQRLKVEAHLFDIIYALLDDVALKAQPQKQVQKITKKIGEATVLKVFDIKKLGVIAGSIVKSGIFSRNGFVKIFRGKQEVGGGDIKSLQRDRKSVKEVHAGYECAFIVEGFSEWQPDDRVECYQEVLS